MSKETDEDREIEEYIDMMERLYYDPENSIFCPVCLCPEPLVETEPTDKNHPLYNFTGTWYVCLCCDFIEHEEWIEDYRSDY